MLSFWIHAGLRESLMPWGAGLAHRSQLQTLGGRKEAPGWDRKLPVLAESFVNAQRALGTGWRRQLGQHKGWEQLLCACTGGNQSSGAHGAGLEPRGLGRWGSEVGGPLSCPLCCRNWAAEGAWLQEGISPGASLPAAPSGIAPVLAEGPVCSHVGKLRQQRRSLHGARGPTGAGGDRARCAEPGSNPKGHPQPWHRPRPLPRGRRKGAAILLPRYAFHPRLRLASAAATGLGEKRVEGGVWGCRGGDVGCPRCWADRGRPLLPCTSWWKGCVSKPASWAGLRCSEHPYPSLSPPPHPLFLPCFRTRGVFSSVSVGLGQPRPHTFRSEPKQGFPAPFSYFG